MTDMPERIWINNIYPETEDTALYLRKVSGSVEYIRADLLAQFEKELERVKEAADCVIDFTTLNPVLDRDVIASALDLPRGFGEVTNGIWHYRIADAIIAKLTGKGIPND